MRSVLDSYERLIRWPGGRWLFSRLVCFRAPYFASIHPLIETLASGECVVSIRHRRRVTNHIGTVHAIALCNMAELAAGLCTDVSLPADMRWIPKGMTVEYLQKAVGTMHARAKLDALPASSRDGYDFALPVEVNDAAGKTVFRASIKMWISPREKRG